LKRRIINKSLFIIILIFINNSVSADYNLDYKIILDSEDYRDNYKLTTSTNDLIYISRTKISLLDLNILLSYYIGSKDQNDKSCYKFILRKILNSNNPINALKEFIEKYDFMFRVVDYNNTSEKISNQFIEVEFSYVKSDWHYFVNTRKNLTKITVWDIGNSMNYSYQNIFGSFHQRYSDLYENKKESFSPLVNIITLAINNNEVYGNKSTRPIFNKSSFIQENFSDLKLLIPFYQEK